MLTACSQVGRHGAFYIAIFIYICMPVSLSVCPSVSMYVCWFLLFLWLLFDFKGFRREYHRISEGMKELGTTFSQGNQSNGGEAKEGDEWMHGCSHSHSHSHIHMLFLNTSAYFSHVPSDSVKLSMALVKCADTYEEIACMCPFSHYI